MKFSRIYPNDGIFEQTFLSLKDRPLVAVVNESGEFNGIVTRYDVLEKKQNMDKFIQKLELSGFRILYIKED